MCYRTCLNVNATTLEHRYNAALENAEAFAPIYHASAFGFPELPIVTNKEPTLLQQFKWGLIPFWVRTREQADKIKTGTINAKSETAFEKPSFKTSMKSKRCLVPSTGFFEFHTCKSKKYPYYITLSNTEIFSFAGIWDSWTDKMTGEILSTFSILTIAANPLMAKIHNEKKRMPVILPEEQENRWLDDSLTAEEITALCAPYDETRMKARAVSRLITSRTENSNVPEALKEFAYPELAAL
jgi:putative SOS response-associated peptidase YedK